MKMPASAPRIQIAVQEEDFDLTTAIAALHQGRTGIGAIASFIGLVRDFSPETPDQQVLQLTIEHYPEMTRKQLARIAHDATRRWPLYGVCIIHRFGELAPGDPIVLVATASAHRKPAFEACSAIMDRLKTEATFWKCETNRQGRHWVTAKPEDAQAARKWR